MHVKEIMVDLETMDVKPTASIISIGAVQFDLDTGEMGKEFYTNVSLKSCASIGLTIDPGTIMWWMNQSDEARAAFNKGAALSIEGACTSFVNFINAVKLDSNSKSVSLWGNGAGFDNVIIRNIYNVLGMKFPLPFFADCDVRTIIKLAPKVKDDPKNDRAGTYHNALDDAKHQVKYMCSAWDRIKNM